MRAVLRARTRPTLVVRDGYLPAAGKLAPWSDGRRATDLHCGAQARIQAHVNKCVRRTPIHACGGGNRTRPTSGVKARHLLPAVELAPLSPGRGATDVHGGAQARIQAHVNGCVERTTIYALGVRELLTPDLGCGMSPLAAGWGARSPVGRASRDRPAWRGSGKNTSNRKQMRKTFRKICVRR